MDVRGGEAQGVKWRHTVTGPEYWSYNNHYPGRGHQDRGWHNVQTLKQQCGRRDVKWGWAGCGWQSQPRPLSVTSPLSLCVGTLSLILCLCRQITSVHDSEDTWSPAPPMVRESPVLWSQPDQLSPSNYDIRWHIPSIGTFKPEKCYAIRYVLQLKNL